MDPSGGHPHVVRPRTKSDLLRCIQLLGEVHEVDRYPLNWPKNAERWIAPEREFAGFVAISSGSDAVSGHVSLQNASGHPASPGWEAAVRRAATELAIVTRLFVDPSQRRAGIASLLLRTATRFAYESGRVPVLDVAQTNDSAIRLYDHLGWIRVGELPAEASRSIPVYLYVAPPSSSGGDF